VDPCKVQVFFITFYRGLKPTATHRLPLQGKSHGCLQILIFLAGLSADNRNSIQASEGTVSLSDKPYGERRVF
jgi:hypothetical protein